MVMRGGCAIVVLFDAVVIHGVLTYLSYVFTTGKICTDLTSDVGIADGG